MGLHVTIQVKCDPSEKVLFCVCMCIGDDDIVELNMTLKHC